MSDPVKPDLPERYQIAKPIGRGGIGTVFECFDKVLRNPVAVKMLRHFSEDGSDLIRFQQEAKATGKLQHPSIVKTYDFGITTSQKPYLVMELLTGQSLGEYIEKHGLLPVEDSLEIAIQLCEGLQYAHSHGVVHRDIKPSNIFLVQERRGARRIKIVDFGLAKVITDDQTVSSSGAGVGSPFYMSPEQARGDPVDFRTDIYSTGCLIFTLLTGKPPFSGSSVLETLQKHMSEPPPRLGDRLPEISFPEDLEDVVAGTLVKDVDERTGSMTELLSALRDIGEDEETGTHAILEEELAETISERLENLATEAEQHKQSVARFQVVLLVLAVVFIMVPVVLSLRAFQKPEPQRFPDTDFTKIPGSRTAILFRTRQGGVQWHLIESDLQVDDDTLANISRSNERVTRLKIKAVNVEGPGLASLKRLDLKALWLNELPINDSSLSYLKELTTLRSIIITSCAGVTGSGLDDLKFLPHLKSITIDKTPIRDEAIVLANLSTLETLRMRQCSQLKGECLSQLARFKALRELSLNNSPVRTNEIYRVLTLPALRHLEIEGADIDESLLSRIASSPVEKLNLSATSITDRGIAIICRSQKLKELVLQFCEKVSAGGLKAFARSNVWSLDLSNNKVDSKGLDALSSLNHLRRLNLSQCELQDNSLSHLTNENLESLILSHNEITSVGLAGLRRLVSLRRLELKYVYGLDKGDFSCLQSLPRLTELDLGQCYITPEMVQQLRDMKKLRILNVVKSGLTDEQVDQIKESLPDCEVFTTLDERESRESSSIQ